MENLKRWVVRHDGDDAACPGHHSQAVDPHGFFKSLLRIIMRCSVVTCVRIYLIESNGSFIHNLRVKGYEQIWNCAIHVEYDRA